jgi:apolipoprotein N-acyltransferase
MVVNSLLMTLPILFYYLIKRMSGEVWGLIAFISAWMAFEFMHLNWEMSWPWLTLGNAFAHVPQLIQWYEYTGAAGGSLWLLAVNAMVYFILKKADLRIRAVPVMQFVKPLLVILIPIAVSITIYKTINPEKGQAVNVAVVQPNYEPHYQKFDISENIQLDHFLTMSKQVVTKETDYLVFPETVFDVVHNRLTQDPKIIALDTFIHAYPKLKLVTGLASYHLLMPNEPPTPYSRCSPNGRNCFEFHNANPSWCFVVITAYPAPDFFIKLTSDLGSYFDAVKSFSCFI